MPSLKVLMYSFKGGAGRTVTSANVAYILAREFRRRVLYIDLDVESAGASILFGLDDEIRAGDCWTLQDVLRGYYAPPSRQTRDDGRRASIQIKLKQFEDQVWPRIHRQVVADNGSRLDFLPSRTVSHSPDERSPMSDQGQEIFERLLQQIDGGLSSPPELVLFDSASGQQDAAMAGLGHCQVLVIFVRWSRQFIYGTIGFIREYLLNGRFCPRIRRILLVPTAVPVAPPEGRLSAELDERRARLSEAVVSTNTVAAKDFRAPSDWITVMDPIHECQALKWDDRVFLMEDAADSSGDVGKLLAEYRVLAATLSKLVDELNTQSRRAQ